MIPKIDGLGNKLVDIASTAHMYLQNGALNLKGSQVDPNKMGALPGQHAMPHDNLVAYAEDTPESDSHMRQTAVYVGELANCEAVAVVKKGKQGHQTWTVRNPLHFPGAPADPVAVAQPSPGYPSGQNDLAQTPYKDPMTLSQGAY